ncbi:MAG: diaminopropionate ammonia-lyase [Deltaproteobacteria bacterium]
MLIKEIPQYGFKYVLRAPKGGPLPAGFSVEVARRVERFHRQLPGYRPTDLLRWSRLARDWSIKEIFIKDESTRFNLKAFKVLGSSYAVARVMAKRLGVNLEHTDFTGLAGAEARKDIGNVILATATDGNHGRGVAWAAEQLQQNAVVYMPKGAVPSRVENIRSHGATVIVTDFNYDDTVRLCRRTAGEKGWVVIQDTAWEGYTEIPLWIMQGYMTMCVEAVDRMSQTGLRPTHVLVQVGVGSLAGAVVGYLLNRFSDNPPRFITIEPNTAACILASAAADDGRPHAVTGDLKTIMAGLACGEPNPIGWEILRDFCSCYLSCEDFVAANGVRILANPLKGDACVEAGESGAVGLGVLDLLCNNEKFGELKQDLAIGPDSTLLFFNTEGATDPENYREIVWHGKYPAPN